MRVKRRQRGSLDELVIIMGPNEDLGNLYPVYLNLKNGEVLFGTVVRGGVRNRNRCKMQFASEDCLVVSSPISPEHAAEVAKEKYKRHFQKVLD